MGTDSRPMKNSSFKLLAGCCSENAGLSGGTVLVFQALAEALPTFVKGDLT